MKALSERNKLFLLEGASYTGKMVDGFFCFEERFYIHEADELLEFCKWVDKNVGGCGEGNIDMLFRAFKNPKDKALQKQVQEFKKWLASIRVK